jgi:hypothetical protein
MRLEQRDKELAAIGASVGCNCLAEVAAAARMAEHVQRRAGEMTAAAASQALDELEGGSGDAARVRRSAPTELSNA